MAKLKAFVGHSFNEEDSGVIATFLKYFDSLKDIGFEWEHAERTVATKAIDDKIVEMMEGKNLFIGIFTRKRKQIDQSHLEPCFWNKQKLKAPADKYSWTTSDWIIQESGYALGKGMKVIFITEEGIEPVGGLQGNLEYIPFSRENIAQSFSKLNESITSLLVTGAVSTQKETKDIPSEEIDKKSEREKRGGEKAISFRKLLVAIEANNDDDEKAALDEMLREDGNEYERVKTKGSYNWLRYKHGKKDVLDDLVTLSKENPDHPYPHIWLGNLYEEYKKYDKAHAHFMNASELIENDSEKTIFICSAAKALIEDGKLKEAKELIIKRLRTICDNSSDDFFNLYHTLAQLQKRNHNDERYLSFAEKALDLKPSDSSTRFELAYTYSKSKNHTMALYHYKILCDSTSNDASWNNLGVELSELALAGKSVDAYLKSKELGGTNAVGNLAYKLIDAGFYSEAKKYLQEALKQENCSPNVISALSNLESKQKQENDKEEELISDVLSVIKFRIKYAKAFIEPFEIELPLNWKTKYGNVDIKIEGDRFVAKGERKIKPALGIALGLDLYNNPYRKRTDEEVILQKIIYQGTIINSVIDYELTIQDEPERTHDEAIATGKTLLFGIAKKRQIYTGFMVINKECNKIEVMEKEPKGSVSFYEMTSNDIR